MVQVATENGRSGTLQWAGYALGFSLGGFFDGILSHQVLQWHHLLSALNDARDNIGLLILTDGLFHVLMYAIAAAGLWLLWRARRDFAAPSADRWLLACALLGFGAWHVVDAVLSHWLLGIHRVRMDVDNPLLWDLLWLAVFGVVPIVAGLVLRRGHTGREQRLASFPLALVLAVGAAGALSAVPAPSEGPVMVVFQPHMTPAQVLGAIRASGSQVVWNDASGQIWGVQLPEGGNGLELYWQGAPLVSNGVVPAGCLNWMRA